jgi:hypothetical protein
MRYQWESRYSFAEIAEALDVATDQVMAVMGTLVLFTPDEIETVWSARLSRDQDGILHAEDRVSHPGMWEELKALIEAQARQGDQ